MLNTVVALINPLVHPSADIRARRRRTATYVTATFLKENILAVSDTVYGQGLLFSDPTIDTAKIAQLCLEKFLPVLVPMSQWRNSRQFRRAVESLQGRTVYVLIGRCPEDTLWMPKGCLGSPPLQLENGLQLFPCKIDAVLREMKDDE